jgi:outer membrane receptor protein involved in Fe transport
MMHLRVVALGLVLVIAWVGSDSVLAQDKEQSGAEMPQVELPEITVTGEQDEKPAATSEVGLEQVISPRIGVSLEDMLQDAPGVDLTRRSYSGSQSHKVYLRGLSESQFLVALDGRSLYGSGVMGGYYVDWSSLLLDDVERVEIIRGARSARYGNTLGGVINVITRKQTAEPKLFVKATLASFETESCVARYSVGTGPWRFSLAATLFSSDGYLRNNYSTREGVGAKLAYFYSEKSSFSFRFWRVSGETGFPVENAPGDPYYDPDYPFADGATLAGPGISFVGGALTWGDGTFMRDTRDQLDLTWEQAFSKSFSARTVVFLTDQVRTEKFFSISVPWLVILERHAEPESDTWGWRSDWTYKPEGHHLEFGAEGHYLGYKSSDTEYYDPAYLVWPPDNTDANKQQRPVKRAGAYIQDKWRAVENLDLHAGLRCDQYWSRNEASGRVNKIDKSYLSPKLGVTYQGLWKGGEVGAYVSHAYRFPTAPETYWFVGGYQPADRGKLAPEQALQYELEAVHKWGGKNRLFACAYYYDVKDYIRTIFGYKPSRVIYNINKVTLCGIELGCDWEVAGRLRASCSYTYQQTKKKGDILDLSNGLLDELGELPRNKASVSFYYQLDEKTKAGFSARYRDQRKVITGNQAMAGASTLARLDSYITVDALFEYNLSGDAAPREKDGAERKVQGRLAVAVENLTNEKYEESAGFPMPGRTLAVSLILDF